MQPAPLSGRPVDAALLREAAQWLLRTQQRPLSAEEQRAFDAWRTRSEQHTLAWSKAEALQHALRGIPTRLGMKVLGRTPSTDRREALKLLTVALVAAPVAAVSYRFLPWEQWTADERTAVGERRTVTLADGSTLQLNTDTAVDVRFDAGQRLVELRRGEIHLASGADAHERPLAVATRNGRMRALGTQFTVRLGDETYLGVSEGAVEVRPLDAPDAAIIVAAGQEIRFDNARASEPRELDENALAWREGILYADRMPLRDFIATLSRYRHGVLQCDPAVADMEISGAFLLNDPDAILDVLQRTRPLRIVWRTRYWGVVQAAG